MTKRRLWVVEFNDGTGWYPLLQPRLTRKQAVAYRDEWIKCAGFYARTRVVQYVPFDTPKRKA